jgi:hypothetical protein
MSWSTVVAFHYLFFPRTGLCRRGIGLLRFIRGFKNHGRILLWPDAPGVRIGLDSLTDHFVAPCSSNRLQDRLGQRNSIPFVNHASLLLSLLTSSAQSGATCRKARTSERNPAAPPSPSSFQAGTGVVLWPIAISRSFDIRILWLVPSANAQICPGSSLNKT